MTGVLHQDPWRNAMKGGWYKIQKVSGIGALTAWIRDDAPAADGGRKYD